MLDGQKSVIIPFTPTRHWELRDKHPGLIHLGKHWRMQKPNNNNKGFINPESCEKGCLTIIFDSMGKASPIHIFCSECGLAIDAIAYIDRFGYREKAEIRMNLARLAVASTETALPSFGFPQIPYLHDSLYAYMPLLDTGFSTHADEVIYLAFFLPHRIGGWDFQKGEWVPEDAYRNLAEAYEMITQELLNNSRTLELTNKRVFQPVARN